ncbi:AAA family ATPase [Myxococcota bacterium]|nr:AAA family ATPase [Myxococcota bacterium]
MDPQTFQPARWWRFDFHTHTPASKDTKAWESKKGTADEVTPEKWLLTFMAAGLDCVAITDHNCGDWIDRLKAAYTTLADTQGPGFRELTLFPGVEISAHGGIHILAILDPSATTADVDTLLGRVDYRGTKGDSDGVTALGLAEVIRAIHATGGLAIPAHADRPKGLLQCEPNSRASRVDANTLRQAVDVEGLLAVEWCDAASPVPQCVDAEAGRLARVLGSDCHDSSGPGAPGAKFTWVKMGRPTLDGLRLALLDGNDASLRRSPDEAGDPNAPPPHSLSAIEIQSARYMGRGSPTKVELSPFFNAIIGGRGTGKSTVLHSLRLASGRGPELDAATEPGRQFERFREVAKGRDGEGALRDDTVIYVEWRQPSGRTRLVWRPGGAAVAVERWGEDGWVATASQALTPERFPVRLLSQGQIATISGTGRRALIEIIDQSAGCAPLVAEWNESRRAFFSLRARLRELDARLAELPEVERRFEDVERKLAAFGQANHAAVLRAYARSAHQFREVRAVFEQARAFAARIEGLRDDVVLEDWVANEAADMDGALSTWRSDVDGTLASLRARLDHEAATLRATVDGWNQDPRLTAWRTRQEAAKSAYDSLHAQLSAQGVRDPGAFARLTQERQTLDMKRKEFTRLRGDRDALATTIDAQRTLIAERRAAITSKRQAFIDTHLRDNPHVRIRVVPHGFDPRQIERELRRLLDVQDDRFADDILDIRNEDGGASAGGLAFELARENDDKPSTIEAARRRLIERDGFSVRFRNYLEKRLEKPEFADHILTWTPDDDVRIDYLRDGRPTPIEHGSPGQRSAALLAFLLAFGEEPIVLDQPEDDLDNQLIYDLVVEQIRENKRRRQLIIVTHNPNIVVNGDAELVYVMEFVKGQCVVRARGALQEKQLRDEVCRVMEGGREALARRWKRLKESG